MGTKAPMGGRKADGRYAGRCRCAVARRIGRILPRLPTTYNTTTPTASLRRAGRDDLPHGGDSPRPSDVARPLLGSPDWNSPARDRPRRKAHSLREAGRQLWLFGRPFVVVEHDANVAARLFQNFRFLLHEFAHVANVFQFRPRTKVAIKGM